MTFSRKFVVNAISHYFLPANFALKCLATVHLIHLGDRGNIENRSKYGPVPLIIKEKFK
jgi:hypothetical protein